MLLNISFEELKDFFTIVLWISIPIVLIASGVAIYLHYRKKKNNPDFGLAYSGPGDMPMSAAMEGVSQQNYYDKEEMGALIKKYEQDIEYHIETHQQLKHEFNDLEEKYMQLLTKINGGEKSGIGGGNSDALVKELQRRIALQENTIEELETALSANQMDEISAAKEIEWKKLLEEQETLLVNKQTVIEQRENELNQSFSQLHLLKEHIEILENERLELNKKADLADKHAPQQLAALEKKWEEERADMFTRIEISNSKLETIQKENELLRQQANKITAPPIELEEYKIKYDQLQQQFTKVNHENEEAKNKMSNQQYLEDIVQEKKLQIEFLQNQLDQRIKSFREMENHSHSISEKLLLLEETAKKYEQELQSVKSLLQVKENEYTHLRETTEKTIGSKITHIELLEREMNTLQQQNNALNRSLEENNKLNSSISKQVNQQTQRIGELEVKLESSSLMFAKIYKELSRSFEGIEANNSFANDVLKKADDNNLNGVLTGSEK
jgi:uncharacterized coiled-coil protein SlyX